MDGDENATRDMNIAIKGCDAVREQTGAAVLVVHHSGKDPDKKGRGSTALPGAVDATMRVYRDRLAGHAVLQVEELRDGEDGFSMRFEPVRHVVGDGLVDAIALKLVSSGQRSSALTPAQALLVEIYERRPLLQKDLIRESVENRTQSGVSRLCKELRAEGLLAEGSVSLTDRGRQVAEVLCGDDEAG
jgi:hypothetical protein